MEKMFELIGSDFWISLIITVIILILKLHLNRRATVLQKKELILTLPGEIEILAIGFLAADISKGTESSAVFLGLFLIGFAFLLIQLIAESDLKDQLSGVWNWLMWLKIIGLYLLSLIALILAIVKGGIS